MNGARPGMAAFAAHRTARAAGFDPWLLGAVVVLILLGLVMVASSSITLADRVYGEPLHYFWRQFAAVAIGALLMAGTMAVPLAWWQRCSAGFLLLAIALLTLVLVPGVGREVNGSMRWLSLGPINVQASEFAKLFIVVYIAGYLVRRRDDVAGTLSGFIRPIAVVTLIAGLLLLEPDFGAAAVIFATVLGMLFMGGVPLGRFFAWMVAAAAALLSLVLISPYRLQRLTSFLDPWDDPFNTGFQLSQALIAFGRGEWTGVGLGSSVQKLFYLPEAHTDFVFAVLAEELGLAGSATVILLYLFVVWRAFLIAHQAEQDGRLFAAHTGYGIGLIFGLQALINIGVNMGVLPTKGLTLPFLSYGSNSAIVSCLLIALLLRIEHEHRTAGRRPPIAAMADYAD
jgi:cell division protein FtsW